MVADIDIATVEQSGGRHDPKLLQRALGRLVTRLDVERGSADLAERVQVTFVGLS